MAIHTPHWEGARPKLDMNRVSRALNLSAVEMNSEPGTFVVTSTTGSVRYVSIRPYYNCECPDAVHRNIICKHLIAALVADGDREAVAKMDELRASAPPYMR